MKRLIIIGASGHGKVVADCAVKNGYGDIVFLDDDERLEKCGSYPVVGRSSEVDKLTGDILVAIGNPGIRQKLQAQINKERLAVLIHPKAVVADDVKIGKGSVVMAGAIINPGAVIGEGCIINTACSVDHDCKLGNFVHVAVGAHLAGSVTVGERTWVGAGATISNNISICGECMIGAGAVVVKDIAENGTYVGVPAKKRLHIVS